MSDKPRPLKNLDLDTLLEVRQGLQERKSTADPNNFRTAMLIIDNEITHKRSLRYHILQVSEDGVPKLRRASVSKVHKPPGHILASAASFLLSKATYQRYIEPHVLDIRTEHYKALQAGELGKARWIVFRGYCQALWPLVVAAWGTIVALVKMST